MCIRDRPATVLLLGGLLTAAVVAHPSLCPSALSTISRSTASAALLCAPLLALWPWAELSLPQLWAAYCELSRVPLAPIADFAMHSQPWALPSTCQA